tara:strand:+ start:7082 stop:7570 length:489 start_codon:yes stop_codon:yes gene_type:complete
MPRSATRLVLRKRDFTLAARKLDALVDSAVRKGSREALTAAAKPGVKSMRAKLGSSSGDSSGALKKSIGVKARTYTTSKNSFAIVGPRRGHSKMWKGKRRVPVFYAHLVNGGFVHNKSGRSIAGTHFVERSLADSRSEMRRIYNREIGLRINKHALRLKGKL